MLRITIDIDLITGDGMPGISALGSRVEIAVRCAHDDKVLARVEAPYQCLGEALALAGRTIGESWRSGALDISHLP